MVKKLILICSLLLVQQAYSKLALSSEVESKHEYGYQPTKSFFNLDDFFALKQKVSAMDLDSKIKNAHFYLKLQKGPHKQKEYIRNYFSFEELSKVSEKGWEAEMGDNEEEAPFYFQIAALGGVNSAQQKWGDYLLTKKKYDDAASWYIEAAKNNNTEVLSYLEKWEMLEDLENKNFEEAHRKLKELWQHKYP
jgi:TPR repeat protein